MRKGVTQVLSGLALAALLVVGGAALTSAQEKDKAKDKGKEPGVTYTFEVYKSPDDKYRFRFKGSDEVQLFMAHKGYDSKDDAMKVIQAIQKEVGKAKVVDMTKKDK